MYESFFHLKEKPFNLTPDPRFIYFTERHCEALANLVYGIRERKGFLVLTGEVGTGKTTLINALLDTLERAGILSAFIFNPLLSAAEFFEYLLADLNIRGDYKNKSQSLIKLNNLLLERYRAGKATVLIVDEAQNLSTEILEEVRLLTNLETATEKLLQIVLVGQPELSLKLNSPELRQIKQRISLRCNLEPLSPAEIKEYINTRMEIAGLPNQAVFADDVIAEIFRLSGGIPRLVNTICDNALLTGYAMDSTVVGLEILEEVADDLELSHLPKFPVRAISGGSSRNWTRTAGNLSDVTSRREDSIQDKIRMDPESFDLFVQFVDKLRENAK